MVFQAFLWLFAPALLTCATSADSLLNVFIHVCPVQLPAGMSTTFHDSQVSLVDPLQHFWSKGNRDHNLGPLDNHAINDCQLILKDIIWVTRTRFFLQWTWVLQQGGEAMVNALLIICNKSYSVQVVWHNSTWCNSNTSHLTISDTTSCITGFMVCPLPRV